MPRAVVCLPTYNERENLERLIHALGEALDTERDGVLVIDDASPDGTGEIADRLAAELPWVSVLHRERKDGIGPAYLGRACSRLDRPFTVVPTPWRVLTRSRASIPR